MLAGARRPVLGLRRTPTKTEERADAGAGARGAPLLERSGDGGLTRRTCGAAWSCKGRHGGHGEEAEGGRGARQSTAGWWRSGNDATTSSRATGLDASRRSLTRDGGRCQRWGDRLVEDGGEGIERALPDACVCVRRQEENEEERGDRARAW